MKFKTKGTSVCSTKRVLSRSLRKKPSWVTPVVELQMTVNKIAAINGTMDSTSRKKLTANQTGNVEIRQPQGIA